MGTATHHSTNKISAIRYKDFGESTWLPFPQNNPFHSFLSVPLPRHYLIRGTWKWKAKTAAILQPLVLWSFSPNGLFSSVGHERGFSAVLGVGVLWLIQIHSGHLHRSWHTSTHAQQDNEAGACWVSPLHRGGGGGNIFGRWSTTPHTRAHTAAFALKSVQRESSVHITGCASERTTSHTTARVWPQEGEIVRWIDVWTWKGARASTGLTEYRPIQQSKWKQNECVQVGVVTTQSNHQPQIVSACVWTRMEGMNYCNGPSGLFT